MAKREGMKESGTWDFVGRVGVKWVWVCCGSGLMTTTFWSVMNSSSAESSRRRVKSRSVVVGVGATSSSSAKNSKVLALKARANLLNISEIWGWGWGLEDISSSGISLSFLLMF